MERLCQVFVSGRRYRYSGKRMAVVIVTSAAGILWAGMVGYALQRLWAHLMSGRLDWPLWQFVMFHLSLLVPLIAFLGGGVHCTAVERDERGLMIRTWYWCWFFVPWQDVIGFDDFAGTSADESCIVSLKRGLTWIHRGLPARNREGGRWPRGFALYPDSEGYAELVSEIKMRLKSGFGA